MIFELSTLNPWQVAIIITCGLLAGLINTIAGGGSTVIVLSYIYLGMPPMIANYANRIPVLIQSGAATTAYAVAKKIQWRVILSYLPPISLGTIIGAWLATDVTEQTINRILLTVLSLTTISSIVDFFIKRKKNHNQLRQTSRRRLPYWFSSLILVATGLYSGLIQVGTGLITYPVFSIILNRDHLTAIVAKVSVISFSCLLSLMIFWSSINLSIVYIGVLTGLGAIVGSIIGVRITISQYGETAIRLSLIVFSIGSLIYLFFKF